MNAPAAPVPFREAVRVWARVALLSFGGPVAQIAVMHRELVEERNWVSEQQFLHGLNYCMLLPGPEAQQLATYIGWRMHGTMGGIVAGGLFVLPGLISMMALSAIYAAWGSAPALEALLFGLKAAVLAIVLGAVVRLGGKALKTPASKAVAAAAFIAVFFLAVPFPAIVGGAALLGLLGLGSAAEARIDDDELPPRRRSWHVPAVFFGLWLAPVALLLAFAGRGNVFTEIALFFSQMAVVTFGGAYAVLAYVAQQAVDHFGWLTAQEMLDGLGLAETTPGPLIMVTQFVGFLAALRHSTGMPPMLAGALGGLLTTWVTFMPCFLWIFLGAPYIERLRHSRVLARALSAITASVVGVILNLAIWFALHFVFRDVVEAALGPMRFDAPVLSSINVAAALLSLAAAIAVLRFKVGFVPVLAFSAAAGAALSFAGAA